jgi:hypothetical protein
MMALTRLAMRVGNSQCGGAQGLSFGMWCAAMRSQGFAVVPIEPIVWKKDMSLWKKDKESSRQFALEIFPQLADRMK